MERELLILGLLKAQSQHGYKINEFIANNLGRVSNMRKATAYAILKRLESKGYASSSPDREGNRPTRLIYSITKEGERRFEQLLRKVLSSADEAVSDEEIGLMFLDHLPLDEAVDCLKQRLDKLERLLRMYAEMPKHGNGMGVDLSIERRVRILEADRAWLRQTIGHLEKLINKDS